MFNHIDLYKLWVEKADNVKIQGYLNAMKGNEKEIEESFYRELEFGTAGMRGLLGAGTNRMNIYTVRRATQGFANYLNKLGDMAKNKGVVIAYDTRNFSEVFAKETAKVLCANGIKVHLFDSVRAVPQASFAIRHIGATAGVVITASHNPKEYNGYKVYGFDGGQLPPEDADNVVIEIDKLNLFTDVKIISEDEAMARGLLSIISKNVDDEFLNAIQSQCINPNAIKEVGDSFKIVYTPFHGTGSVPVKEILKRIGFNNILIVKEQDTMDGNFPTVKSPNPEDKEGFALAIELAKQNDVDLIIGTDPDCDRVGVVVRDSEGIYQTLSGNQTGALLCEYILSSKNKKGLLSEKSTVISTIVSTRLTQAIAAAYNVQYMNVLTGFKYIGEKMTEFDNTGSNIFEFGFEESYGYLAGTHARDKDGVVASMLIAEMSAYYKTKNMSLYDALMEIYQKYGFYGEQTISLTMPGKDGMEKMASILKTFRENPPKAIGDKNISVITDYLNLTIKTSSGEIKQITNLPNSDVLCYNFDDNKSYVMMRPSGTEPKIKLYFGTVGDTLYNANAAVFAMIKDMKEFLGV